MNISALFFKTARNIPEAIAIADEKSTVTFGAFEGQVRAMAAYFTAKGLKPGDRVLVFVPMSVDLYRVVMALFQVGATAVFLDEWVSLERLRTCCQLADCKGFIAPWKFRLAGFFIPEIRRVPLHFSLSPGISRPHHAIYDAQPEDVALLTFTTGSTGTPKAASRSHGFLQQQFEALIEEIQPQQGDVVMTNLPIVLLVNFGTGASSVIARFNTKKAASFKPESTRRAIGQWKVNVLIGSPYFMLQLPDPKAPARLSNVQKVFTGGGPVFPDEAHRLAEGFTKAAVNIVYGSTEAEPIATVKAEDLMTEQDLVTARGLCVGHVFHRITLKIIAIQQGPVDGNQLAKLELPPGELGEIVVAGDHVLRTYWNNEAAFRSNKIVDADGVVWHRTGDAGFVGESGCLYLTGRCNQMIRRGNNWISPFIAEYLIRQTPGVVLGTVLDLKGAITVVVQTEPGADARMIENNLKQSLPFSVDQVVFVAKIPRDPRHFSKVDYETLKSMVYYDSFD